MKIVCLIISILFYYESLLSDVFQDPSVVPVYFEIGTDEIVIIEEDKKENDDLKADVNDSESVLIESKLKSASMVYYVYPFVDTSKSYEENEQNGNLTEFRYKITYTGKEIVSKIDLINKFFYGEYGENTEFAYTFEFDVRLVDLSNVGDSTGNVGSESTVDKFSCSDEANKSAKCVYKLILKKCSLGGSLGMEYICNQEFIPETYKIENLETTITN